MRGPQAEPRGSETIAFLSLHASPLARLGNRENGGLNVYVRSVCEELGARGVHTDVFVRRTDPDQPEEQAMGPRSRVVAIDAGPARQLPKNQLPETREEFLHGVRKFVEEGKRGYSAIHSHYWLSGDVALELSREQDLPWLHTAHTLAAVKEEHGFGGDVPERLLAERRVVKSGATLVANARSEALALERLYGAPPGRVVIAPPGVDLVRFQPRDPGRLRHRLQLEDRLVLMFAGRIEPLKGPDVAVEALAYLQQMPDLAGRVTLLFVGDQSSEGARVGQLRRLADRAKELGVAEQISFLGAQPQDRLALLYCLADIVIVPSHTESFGLVALEAQACGTPVVAAAVGGLEDVVEDQRTGLLVAGQQPQDYAEAIASLLRMSPLARSAMGATALKRARRFTWERTVDLLLPEYGMEISPAEAASLPL